MTCLINKLNIFFIIFILFLIPNTSYSIENRILYKINNEIITTYDLKKELKYLSLINPTIIKLDKNGQKLAK